MANEQKLDPATVKMLEEMGSQGWKILRPERRVELGFYRALLVGLLIAYALTAAQLVAAKVELKGAKADLAEWAARSQWQMAHRPGAAPAINHQLSTINPPVE